MAGRGRSGGQQSRTQALLNMGVERSELQDERVRPGGAPGTVTSFVPNPTYPPLKFKPLPLSKQSIYCWDAKDDSDTTDIKDLSMSLMLLTKNMDKMRNSRFAIREEKKQLEIERYSDRYRPTSTVDNQELDLDWRYFPRELWPAKLRKAAKKPEKKRPLKRPSASASKRIRLDGETDEQMAKRLQELEAKERTEGVDKEEAEDDEEEGEEGNKVLDLGDDVEDEDEELDDGTDYAQAYFENGEDFGGDEDDGLDDPGVY